MSSKRKYMNLSLNKTASNMYEFNKAIDYEMCLWLRIN